ncbi:MAG: hypothetical protein HP491_02670 [Nitrospira sp.]|nr:hypothetical protein [Nitrospira sp.]MBH0184388.1 hypothetical protein [Nitrospira sp.]
MATQNREDNARLNAALKYAEDGWPIVPLHSTNGEACTCRDKTSCTSKGKHPRTPNGIKDATTGAAQIRAHWKRWPNANIGLVTGRASGRVVLDEDVKKGKRGDLSLQELIHEYGPLPTTLKARTPSGGAHYVFRTERAIPSQLGVREGLDVLGENSYFVAAPSVIKGKGYQWEGEVEAAPCPDWVAELKKQDGTREGNIAKIIKELLPLGKERKGNWLVRCPFPLHEDKTPSFEVRLSDGVYRCWSCPQKGSIEDLYAHLKQKTKDEARRIIYPPPAHIDELNQVHAVLTDFGGKCVIMNESRDPTTGWEQVTFSSLHDLNGRYRARRKVAVGRKFLSLAEAWFSHYNRREYRGIVFAPGKSTPGYYNLWRGFPLTPRSGDCHLYLQHLHDNICGKDTALYHYVLNWMALTVQRPWERPGVALVLRGNEGVGKGVFCSQFGKLFGPHFKHVWSTRQLVGNFNAHLANALVVFADEALWAGDKAGEGVLKALITERTMPLEYKGKDLVHVDNHVHLIISTNNQWAVPAGPNARRYCVIDVSDEHMQDTDYFGAIEKEMDNGGREALFHMLLNVKLEGINLRKVPVTDALDEMKRLTMAGTPAEFWCSILERGTLDPSHSEWESRVTRESLQYQYSEWAKHVRHKSTETQLGMAVKKLCPHVKPCRIPRSTGGRHQKGYDFGSLDQCREAFCRYFRLAHHDWEDAEDPQSSTQADSDNTIGALPVSASTESREALVEDLDWRMFASHAGNPADTQTTQVDTRVQGGNVETSMLERGG